MPISEIEKNFLYSYRKSIDIEAICSSSDGIDSQVLNDCIRGNYKAVLSSQTVSEVLLKGIQKPFTFTSFKQLKQNLVSYLSQGDTGRQHIILSIGISCLALFCRYNFCGPLLDVKSFISYCDAQLEREQEDVLNKAVLSELIIDAESTYSIINAPDFLFMSRIIFLEMEEYFVSCDLYNWWLCRYCLTHQKVLDEYSVQLHKILTDATTSFESSDTYHDLEQDRDLKCLYHLETGQTYLYYSDVGKAKYHFHKSISILGLQINLSGSLGKRTYWQEREYAQLLVNVSYIGNPITDGDKSEISNIPILPKDIKLNDDTRRDKIKYKDTDEDIVPNLRPIEQSILLNSLLLLRKSSAVDAQMDEESKAYLYAVLQHPKNWSLQLTALLLRSRIESADFRAMERSLNQIEVIVESLDADDPSSHERLKLAFSTLMLPYWILQQELARMLVRLGCTKSALVIFEKLQLWEDVIICYNDLQMRQRSAEIIQGLLEKEESPKLWCLMGDATDDLKCYEKAWNLSNFKSARAQRCIGNYYYARRHYAEAIPFYEKSLEINPVNFQIWQRLGYCALQTESWEKCASAYKHCSVLEPDSFECWNNMSQAYLKLNQTQTAWKTLQEALRCKHDSWRIWDNFLLVSTSLGYISHALHAYNSILLYKEKHVDTDILGRIVLAIKQNSTDPQGKESKFLYKETCKLLAKLCSEIPTNSELLFLYGDLLFSHDESTRETRHTAMQNIRKSVAAATQKPGWEKHSDASLNVLDKCLRLCHVVKRVFGDQETLNRMELSSIRMLLNSISMTVCKGQLNFSLGKMSDEVEVPFNELNSEIKCLEQMLLDPAFKK